MSYAEAVGLALVQALTEFLPVSSSGHLVLAQRWLGSSAEVDILYNIMLHAATATAVLVYFHRDIGVLLRGLAGSTSSVGSVFGGHARRVVWYVVLANVPTAIIGLFIQRYLMSVVTRADVVGLMLIGTGGVLWWARGHAPQRRVGEMRAMDALTIGLVQGIAVLPGISRAGTTIAGGILLGLDRELAARFSLLVSIPAILGASVLGLADLTAIPADRLGPYVVGMLVAAAAGFAAIDFILRLVRRHRFHLFALYLWPLGAFAILWRS